MRDFSLVELYQMKSELIKDNINNLLLEEIIDAIKYKESLINEDTSATGGPAGSVSGGSVSSMPTSMDSNPQPASFSGITIDPNYTDKGGKIGGYITNGYPTGSNKMMFQKESPMGKDHGPRTGKKSRVKKLDIKSLKDVFAKRQDFTAGAENIKGKGKVMDFNNFLKNDFTTIKKESLNESFSSPYIQMNRDKCDRCGDSTNRVTTMSIFNEQVICKSCKEEERKDPEYKAASLAEEEAYSSGVKNYPGVMPDYTPIKRK